MAHSISSRKRVRQNDTRRQRNRARVSVLKGKVKGARDVLAHGSAADAEKALKDAVRTLDREASRGTLHPNAAARRKSRLTRKLNALKAKG
ncbi:30S ribosomal protein S20 [Phycisphaerae bacterium RAS1]|nr:30S ribosomal protein S20 [Phycisphaerae bacterium RAS1]